ncbi:MAG TPA: hypothetical protein VFM37_17850, partial [Pseudonocardiaceae bacterium]|nr:hypothetical protein [Pseudonocardiaceae bacterium]
MPDWTYQPLRGIAAALLGARRSQRVALRILGTVGALPAGADLIASAFGHRGPGHGRLGAVVPPSVARDALRGLPPLGATTIEISPVYPADVGAVVAAVHGGRQRVRVWARAAGPDAAAVARALAPHVDAVRTGADPAVVYQDGPSVAAAARALADPARTVLATPAVLIAAGPGWFARVREATAPPPVTAPPGLREVGLDPRRWPGWWWALLVGLGMVAAGLGAAAITLGPVLLWYDRDLLGMDAGHLHALNPRLVPFLRHDRISLAGAIVTTGVLYTGLAAGGLRRGWPWAREALLAAGWIGFATVLYFVGFGYVEPLHAAVAVVLLPMFLLGTARRPDRPSWSPPPEGPERERRRALTGQLLLIFTGAGVLAGGAAISVIGLTGVFVASDLVFLRTGPAELAAANPRLPAFIAHDRAGFGGTLLAAGTAITLLSAWGWRRGEAWVWWTLALGGLAGFVPAVAVHLAVGYVDAWHLAPAAAGTGLTAAGLALAR